MVNFTVHKKIKFKSKFFYYAQNTLTNIGSQFKTKIEVHFSEKLKFCKTYRITINNEDKFYFELFNDNNEELFLICFLLSTAEIIQTMAIENWLNCSIHMTVNDISIRFTESDGNLVTCYDKSFLIEKINDFRKSK